jgi:hypothetical protein
MVSAQTPSQFGFSLTYTLTPLAFNASCAAFQTVWANWLIGLQSSFPKQLKEAIFVCFHKLLSQH